MKRQISFYLGKDVVGYVVQCVVTACATSSLSSSTLSEQQWIEQQLGLLEIFGDVYVFVHPKHLWMLGDWKVLEHHTDAAYYRHQKDIFYSVCDLKCVYLNEFYVALIVRLRWGKVVTAFREIVWRFLNKVLIVEVSQDGQQETPVPVVSHTAAIVALTS